MTKQRMIDALAIAIVAIGGVAAATPARAAAEACWLSTASIISISNDVCGESATSVKITDISCSETEASWTVTCTY